MIGQFLANYIPRAFCKISQVKITFGQPINKEGRNYLPHIDSSFLIMLAEDLCIFCSTVDEAMIDQSMIMCA